MRKSFSAVILFIMLLAFVACSSNGDVPKNLNEEGIAPYSLSESEKYILQSFSMAGNSQIISFNAPKEATALNVNVYRLEDGEKWVSTGGGAISIDPDETPSDRLAGTFTMQLKENYAIEFNINSNGLAAYKTDEVLLDSEVIASVKGFLQEFQSIEINREIPVALMIYDSGTAMRSYALQDFFEPAKFKDLDLVQVVTLEFSDK